MASSRGHRVQEQRQGIASDGANNNNHGILAPANGAASDGLIYSQIKDFITQNSAKAAFNSIIV